MPKRYWDEWITSAEAWLSGKAEEPPEAPGTARVLRLACIVKELDRLLSDPRSTASMPALHKAAKRALSA